MTIVLFYILPTVLFLVEIWAFSKRKKAIQNLYECATCLAITSDTQKRIVEKSCQRAVSVWVSFRLLLVPFGLFKKDAIDFPYMNALETHNGKDFYNFLNAIGLVAFYTSPALYVIFVVELGVMGLLALGAEKMFNTDNMTDKIVLNTCTTG